MRTRRYRAPLTVWGGLAYAVVFLGAAFVFMAAAAAVVLRLARIL